MRALISLSLADPAAGRLRLAAAGPRTGSRGRRIAQPGAVKVDGRRSPGQARQFDPNSIAALKDPRSPLSKRSIYFDYDSYVVKDEFQACWAPMASSSPPTRK
jgi:peptidoglycan-associated lipoprotein